MTNISPWIARLVLAIMTPIGAGAIWLTRKYASASIETLPEQERAVRQLSIDLLLFAHVALVIVVALLPTKQFRALRVALAILSLGIWAFDGVGMYASRFGIMDRAETTLVSAAQRVSDQRAAIKGLQDSAVALRATAARQAANTMITASAQSLREAARLETKAAALAEQLAAMPDGSGTSEVRQYGGQENAMWRAVAEAALVSLVLVAACVLIGLMLREVLHGLSLAAGGGTVPPPAKRPTPPALAEPRARTLRAASQAGRASVAPASPAPAQVQDGRDDAPVAPTLVADAPTRVQKQEKQVQSTLEAVAPAQVEAEIAPAEVQSASRRTVPEGLREAIKSGACKPSQGAVKKLVGGNWGTAARHLQQLGEEGILESAGNGRWKLKTKD